MNWQDIAAIITSLSVIAGIFGVFYNLIEKHAKERMEVLLEKFKHNDEKFKEMKENFREMKEDLKETKVDISGIKNRLTIIEVRLEERKIDYRLELPKSSLESKELKKPS